MLFSSVARGNRIGKSEEEDTEGIRPRGGAVLAVGLQRARQAGVFACALTLSRLMDAHLWEELVIKGTVTTNPASHRCNLNDPATYSFGGFPVMSDDPNG